MRTNEAILEFLVPGIVACIPLILLIFKILGIVYSDFTQLSQISNKENFIILSFFGFAFFSFSYLVGIILNSISGYLFREKAGEKFLNELKKNRNLLYNAGYAKLRGNVIEELTLDNVRDEAEFIRAYCRINSDQAAADIRNHSNLVRILRSSILSFLLGTILMGSLIITNTNLININIQATNRLIIGSTIILIGSICSYLLHKAYLDRLKILMRSAIAHFIALRI